MRRFQVKFTPKVVEVFSFFFFHMTEWGPASNVISRLTFWHQCSTHIRAWYELSLGPCWWGWLTYSTEYCNRLSIVWWQTLWYQNISSPCPKNQYNIALWWNLEFTPPVVIYEETFIFPFPTMRPSQPNGSLGITMNVAPYCSIL